MKRKREPWVDLETVSAILDLFVEGRVIDAQKRFESCCLEGNLDAQYIGMHLSVSYT